jgi:ribosomal protein S18 acetylase RimI-like enzyme
MELADVSAVYALGEKLFTAKKWRTLYRTWDEYEVADFFLSDGEYCLVAEQHGAVVGFILGTLIEKRRSAWVYGYVVWLGVAQETKRTGIGSKLLARLTELFIRDGARMMIADTEMENTDALSFFAREGFGNTVKHVYFSRNLSSHPDYLKRRSTDRPKTDTPRSVRTRRRAKATAPDTHDAVRIDPAAIENAARDTPVQ